MARNRAAQVPRTGCPSAPESMPRCPEWAPRSGRNRCPSARNGRPGQAGIGAQVRPESVPKSDRKTHVFCNHRCRELSAFNLADLGGHDASTPSACPVSGLCTLSSNLAALHVGMEDEPLALAWVLSPAAAADGQAFPPDLGVSRRTPERWRRAGETPSMGRIRPIYASFTHRSVIKRTLDRGAVRASAQEKPVS